MIIMMDDPMQEAQICPQCSHPVGEAEEKRFCPQCGTMHHADCWQARGGRCAVPGCAASAAELPPPMSMEAPSATGLAAEPTPGGVEEAAAEPLVPPESTAEPEGIAPPGEPLPPVPGAVPVPGVESLEHYARAEVPVGEPVPLEDRERYGTFRGLWKTWADASFTPGAFFPKVRRTEDVGLPLLFVFLYAGITSGLFFLWWALMEGAASAMPDLPIPRDMARRAAIIYGVIALIAPIGAMVLFFLRTLVSHLLLLLFGGARKGLVMTLRAMAYAQAPGLFAVVPCCGVFIWWFWSLVLEILGLAEAHETDTWRPALAVLLPTLLCCMGIVAWFVIIGGPVMQELQKAGFPLFK
jgi:hypothetical protein